MPAPVLPFNPAHLYPPRRPEDAGWPRARQRKYPDLFTLWQRREYGRQRGVCFVCSRPWTDTPRIGCGGCNDLHAWWPSPGVDVAAPASCPRHGAVGLRVSPHRQGEVLRWWECRAEECDWHELRLVRVVAVEQLALIGNA
jgi:hypothetical protein